MKDKTLSLQDYQSKAMETCMASSENVSYMLTNLIGEVGEVSEKLVKGLEYIIPDNVILQHLKIFVQISKFYGSTSKKLRKDEDDTLRYAAEDMQNALYSLNEEDFNEIGKELGDALWQLSGVCSVMGLDLEEIAQGNLDKLASRKNRNKIDGDGDNR